MRAVAVLIVVGLLGPSAVLAQTLPDGPLAAPGAAVSPTKSASKSTKAAKVVHPKVAHHAKTAKTDAAKAGTPPQDSPGIQHTTEDNPLSLGMKWNGSNDNASQTRVQNYGGDAAGTGAAVGLKLHF